MEKLDKERYLKRVIVVCWIALAICFGIKVFGGNLFEIMCNNENFIKVCDYAENNLWLNYLLNCVYSFVSISLFCLAICGKIKYKRWEFCVALASIIVSVFVKHYSVYWGLLCDIWVAVIFPCIMSLKTPKRHIYVIPANLMVLVFQFVSMYIKNITNFYILDDDVLVGMIYSIDVLIMLCLYYLYSNIIRLRKE